jgi:DNA-directed RNA polymerase subunit E'/Rpb7
MEIAMELNNNDNNNMQAMQQPKFKNKKKEIILSSIYSRSIITRTISLPITAIGKNLKQVIEEFISFHYEGKCVVEGFIKPQSTKIITYSSGTIKRGNFVSFDVVFECQVCFPVEGTNISCIAKTNTKAGITAESADEKPSPIIVFIARDHHYYSSQFNDVKEGDKINIRVIGQRFELNDKFVSIIGELIRQQKPKLVIEG